MVYTILTAFLCILICMTIFSLELYKRRDTSAYMTYITRLNSDQESKEFILTDANTILMQNVNPVNKANIDSYLVLNKNSMNLKHNRDFSIYDIGSKLLVISCYYDQFSHKEYYYNIDIKDSNLIYTSFGEVVVAGGI